MKLTELDLVKYSKPLSDTEKNKCINAIRVISDALKNIGYSEEKDLRLIYEDTFAFETKLKKNNSVIKLLVQGSYANNTNVRAESDVDIAVIQENIFTTRYNPKESSNFDDLDRQYGFYKSDYSFIRYKREIYDILIKEFGLANVEWNNKCISVNGNTYRVDTDTVPARRYRDYSKDTSKNPDNYVGGIRIQSDEGDTIINYPEQHIINGRNKNQNTNRFFKKIVRIVKRLRYIMIEDNVPSASQINSFKIESILWNIPDYKYTKDINYTEKLQGILDYLRYISFNELDSYKEINGIKNLVSDTDDKQSIIDFVNALDHFYKFT